MTCSVSTVSVSVDNRLDPSSSDHDCGYTEGGGSRVGRGLRFGDADVEQQIRSKVHLALRKAFRLHWTVKFSEEKSCVLRTGRLRTVRHVVYTQS